MITNTKEINKKLLQNYKKYDIMNNRFGNSSTKEQDIPDSLRSSSKWLKDLYGELSSAKPVGISEKKRLESLLSDFNTEAENIGKLDSKTRDLPHIQEYMKNKYGKSHIFGSSEGIIGSQGKSNAPDNSVPDNSKKSIALPKYRPFPKQLSPDTGRNSTRNLSFNNIRNGSPIKSSEAFLFENQDKHFPQKQNSEKITKFSFNEKEFLIPPEEREIKKNEEPLYGEITNQRGPEMNGRYLKDAPVSDVGCEAIAIHNVLFMLDGKGRDFNEVLKKCEKIRFPSPFPFTRRGAFGCNPYFIGEILDEFNINHKQQKKYNDAYNSIKNSKSGDVFIVSYWNDGKIMNGLHTVAVKVIDNNGSPKFEVLNVYGNKQPYNSWDEFVADQMGTSDGFITMYEISQ